MDLIILEETLLFVRKREIYFLSKVVNKEGEIIMEFQQFNQLWNNADYNFRLALVMIDYFNKFEKHIIPTDEFTSVLLRNLRRSVFADYKIHNSLIRNLEDAGIIKKIEIDSDETHAFSLTQFGVNLIFYNQKKINIFIEENKITFKVLPAFVNNI